MMKDVRSASLTSQFTPLKAVDNVGGFGEKIAVMGGNKVG
jgi:hypothetical protein